MIRTQLCPIGELENKNWWFADVGFLLLVCVLSYLCVGMFLDEKRSDIEVLVAKKTKWEQEYEAKKPGIEKFKTLKDEMDVLNKKIGALKKITTSKVDKVKPLVALDQLQTLWMDGVWYESLEYAVDGTTTIRGSAFDSLLIGEYMLGVRETMNSETKNDDLRTQIGFDEVSIKSAKLSENFDDFFRDIKDKMSFELKGKHIDKPSLPSASVSSIPRPRSKVSSSF